MDAVKRDGDVGAPAERRSRSLDTASEADTPAPVPVYELSNQQFMDIHAVGNAVRRSIHGTRAYRDVLIKKPRNTSTTAVLIHQSRSAPAGTLRRVVHSKT